MNKVILTKQEKKQQAWNLPIQHSFHPLTGEHLPQCKYADELYFHMLLKQSQPVYKPYFPKVTNLK